MFSQEMSAIAPAPPLVFDLALIKAARWHSYYQIINGQVHVEEEGKKGFTAPSSSSRAQLAGFHGNGHGENIFRTAKNPWYCHAAFVVDWGNGPGGMQPTRGHRANILNPRFRVAGIGAVPWPETEAFAVTHEFGGNDRRMLGGVVFDDRKRSRTYEIGEGVGGVAISTAAAHARSWKSGAYAVELPKTDAKLTVELAGAKYVCTLPDGEENVKFDVIVSDLASFKRAGKLLAASKRIPETQKGARFAALVNLYWAIRDVLVEESVFDEVNSLVKPVRAALESDMVSVRREVGDAATEETPQAIRAIAAKYSHTKAELWFTDALTCTRINATYLRLKALSDKGATISATTLNRATAEQKRGLSKLTTSDWRKFAAELSKKTLAIGDNGGVKKPRSR